MSADAETATCPDTASDVQPAALTVTVPCAGI